MGSDAFDLLARTVARPTTRRGTLALVSALGLNGLVVFRDDGEAKKRKKHKKCGPCRIKKKGKCKGNKPEGTACLIGGICRDGRCVAQVCTSDADCPGFCECERDVNGVAACIAVASGNCIQNCTSNAECTSGFCQVSGHCGSVGQTCVQSFCTE